MTEHERTTSNEKSVPVDAVRKMTEFRNLFPANPVRSSTEAYFRWKIEENPAGRGTIHLAERAGRTAGSCTLTPRAVRVFGRDGLAGECGDAYTHPDFRRQGVFVETVGSCTRWAVEQRIEVVFAIPNAKSQAGCETRLNYGQCPHIKLRVLTKPLRVKRGIRRRLLALLDPSRWTGRQDQAETFAGPDGVAVERITEFGGQTDGLWGRDRFEFCVRRDADYLNWRFFRNPDPYLVWQARRDGAAAGYLAARWIEPSRLMIVCDFITVDDDSSVFGALLQAMEAQAKALGAASVQVHCLRRSPYYPMLTEAGFTDAGDPSERVFIVYGGTAAGERLIHSEGRWHFTLADSDNI